VAHVKIAVEVTRGTCEMKKQIMRRIKPLGRFRTLTCTGALVLAGVASTGCQVDVGGQTLPSPYYMYDDVQYFPPGPEFKLSNEAAAMKAAKAQQALQGG
jgi:hypothetical protein